MGSIFTSSRYPFSLWDVDLDQVASRFRTTPQRIYEQSRSLNATYYAATFGEFRSMMKDGAWISVPLPLEERSWRWEQFTPKKGATLSAICAAKNTEKARTGMPHLTPAYIWRHVLNYRFREVFLERARLRTEELDGDPSAVTIGDAAPFLLIPYPFLESAGHVSIAPHPAGSGDTAKKHVIVAKPAWLAMLGKQLQIIDDKTEQLEQLNLTCDEYKQRCSLRAARLAPLRILLETIIEQEPVENEITRSVGVLHSKLVALQDVAGPVMSINPASFIEMEADKDRQKLTKDLSDTLRFEGFKKLVDRAIEEPDLVNRDDPNVNGSALINRISRTLNRAYAAFGDAYYAMEHEEDIQSALDVVGKAKKGVPPTEAKIALASVLSIIDTEREQALFKFLGQSSSVLGPSLGNLPGPSSLGVAIAKYATIRNIARQLTGDTAAGPVRQKVHDLWLRALKFTDAEKSLFKEAMDRLVKDVGHLKGTSLGDVLVAGARKKIMVDPVVQQKMKALTDSVANRCQKSLGWAGAVLAVNIMAFGYTWWNDDADVVRYAANLLGSGLTGSAAFVKAAEAVVSMKVLSSADWRRSVIAFSKWLDRPVPAYCFGLLGGFFAFASGLSTALDGYRTNKGADLWSGGLQVLGGGALIVAATAVVFGIAPYSAIVIWPEIIASLSLSISAVAGAWDALEKLAMPATAAAFMYHLETLGSSKEFKELSARAPELKRAFDEVTALAATTRFADFDVRREAEVKDRLSGKFADKDIHHMLVKRMPLIGQPVPVPTTT